MWEEQHVKKNCNHSVFKSRKFGDKQSNHQFEAIWLKQVSGFRIGFVDNNAKSTTAALLALYPVQGCERGLGVPN